MSIDLKPLKAQRIDLSNIVDIERERLRIIFKNGTVLYFKVSTAHGVGYEPRLILDSSTSHGVFVNHYDSRNLFETLARRFYDIKVQRSWIRETYERIRILMDPFYSAPYLGWSTEKLFEEFEVELKIGSEWKPSGLGVYLELKYGTRNGTMKLTHFEPSKVESVGSILLAPLSLKDSVASTPSH